MQVEKGLAFYISHDENENHGGRESIAIDRKIRL